ncbi:MAG TPA: 2-oxoacid:acceptor oxidoreductase family protein [Mycobacteriales bacterium]|nr:2-oxoacid:acceptor oxidoreductase family protein [Mycobacteriales bacterium]
MTESTLALATRTFEVRIHGRGGQGAVSAAELLSIAAFDSARVAQAFPSFGSERSGAPVAAFCRISDRPIRSREPIVAPDAVIVLDPTLLTAVDVFQGLKLGGVALVNSVKAPEELGLGDLTESRRAAHVMCVPATEIAVRQIGRPVPNGVMLGGFSALTQVVPLSGIQQALMDRFPGRIGTANAAAAGEAFEIVTNKLRDH